MNAKKLSSLKDWIFGIMFILGLVITWNQARAETTSCPKKLYTIKKGDTLLGIVFQTKKNSNSHMKVFGKGGAFQEIVSLNPRALKNVDLIYPGQRIQLPLGLTPQFAQSLGCAGNPVLSKVPHDSTREPTAVRPQQKQPTEETQPEVPETAIVQPQPPSQSQALPQSTPQSTPAPLPSITPPKTLEEISAHLKAAQPSANQ